jgi:hypothetical protein
MAREQPKFAVTANQKADNASANRAPDCARQIIDRRLQGAANAHLRDDDRGEYRPERHSEI